jgi:hypothetical protein
MSAIRDQKEALLADIIKASQALGRIDDGPHEAALADFAQRNVEKLKSACLDAMAGLAFFEAQLREKLQREAHD